MTTEDHYFQAMKRSIVDDLFVRTADENYIVARWASAQRLNVDFFWMAVHALEKYMKAILLINGCSSKGLGHNIVDIYSKVHQIASDMFPSDLIKPADLKLPFWRTRTVVQFLQHLHDNGNAHNRYLIFGTVRGPEDIHMLDEAVFRIRRLIRPLDERVFLDDGDPETPTFTHRQALKDGPRFGYGSLHMPLDKVISSSDESPLRRAALNLNMAFAPEGYPHQPEPGFHSSHEPVLLRHMLDPLKSPDLQTAECGLRIAQWVQDNIELPGSKKNPGVAQQIAQAVTDAIVLHPSLAASNP
jgi:hypothetical protein